MSGFQYRLENLSLSFQHGVRRSIIIFIAVCVLMLAPMFFIGQFLSATWFQTPFNPWRFDNQSIFNSREVVISDLEIGRSQILDLNSGERVLYLTASNRANSEVGFFPWVYTLQILDENDVLLSEQPFQSYLLPEEVKFLVATFPDDRAASIRYVRSDDTKAVDFNPAAGTTVPDVEILSQTFEENSNDTLQLKALFRNNGQSTINKIDILYIIRDARQSVVGIGNFSFNGFVAGSTREMNVTYPKPKDRIPRSLDVRWSVNYLDSGQFRF